MYKNKKRSPSIDRKNRKNKKQNKKYSPRPCRNTKRSLSIDRKNKRNRNKSPRIYQSYCRPSFYSCNNSNTETIVYKTKDIEKIVEKQVEQKKIEGKDQIAENENNQCCICMTNKKCISLQPCGHIATCIKCNEQIEETCPICREKIAYKNKVFI